MDVYQGYAVSQTLKKEIMEAGVNVLCVDYMKEEKKFELFLIRVAVLKSFASERTMIKPNWRG